MSIQFVFFHSPGKWDASPPHLDNTAPDYKILQNITFNPKGTCHTQRQQNSASNGILWLPLGSIVAAFASGHNTHPPADNLTPFAQIDKFWHQEPNQHITIQLGWNDEQGNLVKTFGRAHVHRNGLESIREWSTGGTLVRPYGQAAYDWHPPKAFAHADAAQEVPVAAPVPVTPDWANSDEEAEQEGWGRRENFER